MTLSTHDGAKVYTPVSLKLYDWWVLNISNSYAWHCDTNKYLIPHFKIISVIAIWILVLERDFI